MGLQKYYYNSERLESNGAIVCTQEEKDEMSNIRFRVIPLTIE